MVDRKLIYAALTYHILRYIFGPKSDEPLFPPKPPVFSYPSCSADTPWAEKWPITLVAPDFFDNFVAGNCTTSAELRLAEVVVPTCDRVWGEEVEEDGEEGFVAAPSPVESEHVAPPQHSRYRPLGGATRTSSKATDLQQRALSRLAWYWCCIVLCSVGFFFGLGTARSEQYALQGRQSQGHDDSVVVALREARMLLRKQNVLVRWFRSLGLSMSARVVALALEMDSLRSVVDTKDNEIAQLVHQANLDKSEIADLVRGIARLREEQQSAADAAKLSAIIETLRADLKAKDGRLSVVRGEIVELKSSMEASEAKAAELLASYSAKAEEVERLNDELARLQGEFQTKLRDLGSARAAAAREGELQQTISHLESRLSIEASRSEMAVKELEKVQAEYSACYSRAADLVSETSTQKASIAYLKGEVDRLKSAVSRPQPVGQVQNLQRLQENTRKLQVSNTALQGEVREKDGRIAAMRQEIAQLRASNGQLAADLASKAQEKERLEEEVRGLRNAAATAAAAEAKKAEPKEKKQKEKKQQHQQPAPAVAPASAAVAPAAAAAAAAATAPAPPEVSTSPSSPPPAAGGSGRDGSRGGDEIVVRLPQESAKATTRAEIEGLASVDATLVAQLGYRPSPQTLDPSAPAYVHPDRVVALVEQRFEEALHGDNSGRKRTRRAGALVSWHRQWLRAVGNAYPTWMPSLQGDGKSLEAAEMPPSLQALHLVPGVVSGSAPRLARPLADIPVAPSSPTATKGSKGGELALSKWAR